MLPPDPILYPYLRRWENDIEAREKRFENDSNPVNFQILSILVQHFRVLGLVQDASHLVAIDTFGGSFK